MINPVLMQTLLETARKRTPYFRTPSHAERTLNWFMYGDPNYPYMFSRKGKVTWIRITDDMQWI